MVLDTIVTKCLNCSMYCGGFLLFSCHKFIVLVATIFCIRKSIAYNLTYVVGYTTSIL
jgi:hypothetical protein